MVHALATRLHSSLSRPTDAVLPILCASYALELLSSLCAALLQQGGTGSQVRQDLRRALVQLEVVIDIVITAVVKGRVGKQCLDDLRRAEGSLHGYLTRGPLDGVLSLVAVTHALEDNRFGSTGIAGPLFQEAHGSLAWRTVRFLVATEDTQAVLSAVGPRGLLRLLDLLFCFREAVEPSVVALRFCLSLLWALQSLSVLPHGDAVGAPHLAVAFRAAVDLILRIFGSVCQVQSAPGGAELHADFQNFRTIPTIMQFLGGIPHLDPKGWQAMGEAWWRALAACLQLLGALVLQHPALARDFVQQEGLHLLTERRLLSAELAADLQRVLPNAAPHEHLR